MAGIEKLSNQALQNAKPKSKEYTLSDGGNLYLRVRPNGTKNWLFIYSHPISKKRVKIGLGAYPASRLADVRKTAKDYRSQIAKGADPKAYRINQQSEKLRQLNLTFLAVAEEFLEKQEAEETIKRKRLIEQAREIARIHKTPFEQHDVDYIQNKTTTSHRKRLLLKLHIYPHLQNIPVNEINAPSVIEILKPIQTRGTLETLSRACCILNQIMNHAVHKGYIHSNCLASIRQTFAKHIKRSMPTVHHSELAEVMAITSNTRMKIVTRCAFEMQLHTLTRAAELSTMRWCDIDFKEKLWRIPNFHTKSKREHLVPLSKYALFILEYIKPLTGSYKHVFPSDRARGGSNHISASAVNCALRGTSLKGKLVSHGFRSIGSTKLNEAKFNRDAIEAALSHLDSNQTRASYNNAEYLDERRDIAEYWSQYIVDSTGKYYSIASQLSTA